MKAYTLADDHDLYLYDPRRYYQNSDWLHSIIKHLKQLTKVDSAALYFHDSWIDEYICVQTVDIGKDELPENLPSIIIEKMSQYKNLTKKTVSTLGLGDKFKQISIASIVDQDVELGYVLFLSKDKRVATSHNKKAIVQAVNEMTSIIVELRKARQYVAKSNKYEMMYDITQKFHSTMNPNSVLTEITEIITSIYPNFNCELYLSKNEQDDQSLPIKEFIYNEKYSDEASAQAFLTGKLKIERGEDRITLYAPFNGKQGVYGVMQLMSAEISQVPKEDVEFIRLLANAAGNALENAQLYQQSNLLIQDLQLINTFAHELNKLNDLSSVTQFIKNQIQRSFVAEEIGFILLNESNSYEIEAQSTNLFHSEESAHAIQFMLELVKNKKEDVFISDIDKHFKEIVFPYRSVMLLPMIQSDLLIGVIMVMHSEPYYFTFDQHKLMISLVQHTTLAFDNIILREKLERSVITDYLTQLYSREYLDQKCLEHLKKDQQGVFLLLDLDDFKMVNDSYGHDVGDTILIQVSNIIRREIDGKGFAARWGGEELAIYLAEANGQMGRVFANKILSLIEHSTKPRVTASIGLAQWNHEDKMSLDKLFDQADQALYKAKRLGKNQYQVIIV